MKAIIVVIIVAAAMALGLVIARDRPSADQEAVDYRQALMTVIGGVTDPLLLMHQGRLAYDGALVRKHAAELPVLSGMVAEAFARDTRAASHLDTATLPYVWSDPAAFGKSTQQLADAAAALQRAARGGDETRIQQAIQGLDDACARCHRQFRAH